MKKFNLGSHFVPLFGPFKKRWWMRPICFFKGHNPVVDYIYGIRYRQCSRCGKSFFSGIANKVKKALYKGEIGNLYGIRFVRTNVFKGVKK